MSANRDEVGAVTAETAAVIPVLVLVAAVLAWVVSFGVTQVRAIDAARETARALARGEDRGAATELGTRVAPHGSSFQVDQEGDTVVVRVRADVRGPAGLFALVPGHRVEAEAVALREPSS